MARDKPAEIKALSGARALPPLILVLYHFGEGHHYQKLFAYDALVAKGYLWVEFFFALSGFILVHVYGRAEKFGYLAFLKARLARLYPLHLFMLLVILSLVIGLRELAGAGGYVSIYDAPYHPVVTWQSFVANLFLVQAWNVLPSLTWNGAAWFVSVEFLLCLLFPVYLRLSRGGAWRGALLVVLGAAALAWLARTTTHGLDLTFHDGIYRGMAGFCIGVGMSMLHRKAMARGGGALPEGLYTLAQTAALLLLGDAVYRTSWAHTPNDIYVALAMALLIFTLAFDRGRIARALSTAPVLKLGEWSYAIYMGQTAWLQLLRYFEQRWYPDADPAMLWWAEPLGLLAVCILWGALLATFVEIPANRLLRKL